MNTLKHRRLSITCSLLALLAILLSTVSVSAKTHSCQNAVIHNCIKCISCQRGEAHECTKCEDCKLKAGQNCAKCQAGLSLQFKGSGESSANAKLKGGSSLQTGAVSTSGSSQAKGASSSSGSQASASSPGGYSTLGSQQPAKSTNLQEQQSLLSQIQNQKQMQSLLQLLRQNPSQGQRQDKAQDQKDQQQLNGKLANGKDGKKDKKDKKDKGSAQIALGVKGQGGSNASGSNGHGSSGYTSVPNGQPGDIFNTSGSNGKDQDRAGGNGPNVKLPGSQNTSSSNGQDQDRAGGGGLNFRWPSNFFGSNSNGQGQSSASGNGPNVKVPGNLNGSGSNGQGQVIAGGNAPNIKLPGNRNGSASNGQGQNSSSGSGPNLRLPGSLGGGTNGGGTNGGGTNGGGTNGGVQARVPQVRANGQLGTLQGQPPLLKAQVPRLGVNVQGQLPTIQGQPPLASGNLPNGSGTLPNGSGNPPTIQLPNGPQIQLPQLPVLGNLPQLPFQPQLGGGTQLPGGGTQLPGGGTQLPGGGTQLPGGGTQLPGGGPQLPGGGTQLPGGQAGQPGIPQAALPLQDQLTPTPATAQALAAHRLAHQQRVQNALQQQNNQNLQQRLQRYLPQGGGAFGYQNNNGGGGNGNNGNNGANNGGGLGNPQNNYQTNNNNANILQKEFDKTTYMPQAEAKARALIADPRKATDDQIQKTQFLMTERQAGESHSPKKSTPSAKAAGQAQANQAGNSAADVAREQAVQAIDYCSRFMKNFTTQGGNKWNRFRDQVFVPMAILLLLPGAVVCQVRAIISQGSPIVGQVSPIEGINRGMIAVFLIPGSYLICNYAIDLGNSIQFTVADEYQKLFHSDMYEDAMCAEIRAFGARYLPENDSSLKTPPWDFTPRNPQGIFSKAEARIWGKLEDPCSNLFMVPANRDDASIESSNTAVRSLLNTTNAAMTTGWSILCAFQMAFFYYLFFVGPVMAALWVWPMKFLRDAFGSWVEGVITLCFWSLFWSTTILLLACFKGTDDTGIFMITAINFLATASVKYAFDFGGLVKAAGQKAAELADKAGDSK